MAELKGRSAAEGEAGFRALLEAGRAVVTAIRNSSKIFIAAVNGVAAGAGATWRWRATCGSPPPPRSSPRRSSRSAFTPTGGGMFFLPALAGPARAAEVALTGRLVEAREAYDWGLVNRVVPDGNLMDETLALADEIAEKPAGTLARIKRTLTELAGQPLDAVLDAW